MHDKSRTTSSGRKATGKAGVDRDPYDELAEEIDRKIAANPDDYPPDENVIPLIPALAALDLLQRYDWMSFPAKLKKDGDKWVKSSYLSKARAPGHENWGATRDPEQLRKNFLDPKWQVRRRHSDWPRELDYRDRGRHDQGPQEGWLGVAGAAAGELQQAAGHADGAKPERFAASLLQAPWS
jgi:hypothetical protein